MPELDSATGSPGGWVLALDELEASLGAAASGGEPADWAPPAGLGPIPRELEDRARRILAGQSELIAELEGAKRTTAAHLAALRKVPATREGRVSVYLDTTG